jgi:hypothetical protein
MDIIKITGLLSLSVQIITGLIDAYVLTIDVIPQLKVLSQLLLIEFIVQIIEGSFYIWMVTNFSSISNITPYRYWDWSLSTPMMLLTLSIYLKYKSETEEKKKIPDTLINYIKQYIKPLSIIIIMDLLMLYMGYLGETKYLSIFTSTILGFIPFSIMFYIIYNTFVIQIPKSINIFLYFVGVWGLYGVAALLPYNWKNSIYNILDLFAKNFFGIFLAYTIYTTQYPSNESFNNNAILERESNLDTLN